MNCMPRTRGFTLIELMVALTILALLSAVVFSGLNVGLNAWSKANKTLDQMRDRRVMLVVLEEQLRGALPLLYWTEEGPDRRSHLAFEGERTHIRLVTRASFVHGPDGVPHWLDLRWTRPVPAERGRLVLEEVRILPPDNLPEQEPYFRGEVLESADFELEYLRPGDATRPPEWLKEWKISDQRGLPASVRLGFQDQGSWIRLVIPVDDAESNWNGFQVQ